MPTKTTDPNISSALTAVMLGISQSQLSQLKAQIDNALPFVGKVGREFLYNIHAVHEWDVKRRIKMELTKNTGMGESSADVLDFHAEKTRLTKAQADAKELDNLEKMGKLAEIDLLKETLSTTLNSVAAILDSIPAEMRRQCPHLSQADIDEIATVVATIRNSIHGADLPLPEVDKASPD